MKKIPSCVSLPSYLGDSASRRSTTTSEYSTAFNYNARDRPYAIHAETSSQHVSRRRVRAIPLVITGFIVWYVDSKTRPVGHWVMEQAFHVDRDVPFLGVVAALVAIYLVGILTTSLLGQFLLKIVDSILMRLPVPRTDLSRVEANRAHARRDGRHLFQGRADPRPRRAYVTARFHQRQAAGGSAERHLRMGSRRSKSRQWPALFRANGNVRNGGFEHGRGVQDYSLDRQLRPAASRRCGGSAF